MARRARRFERSRPRAGMTLVELLMVVAIVGMLTALSLPAINAARESGRRTQCLNHVRQLALASFLHENSHGFLPSGGWGGGWVGIPDRGVGPQQPGGWIYSILPYLDRSDLAELGRDATGTARDELIAAMLRTPLSVLHCPSRRLPLPYPLVYDYARHPLGAAQLSQAARCDFAINCGDQERCEVADWFGPSTLAMGDHPKFRWPDVSDHTGISYLRSRVTFADIRDGASNVYLIGEKYVSAANHTTGADLGDDWSMYSGYQDDAHRSTYQPPRRDGDETKTCRFGSIHPSVWQAAFCDGSARSVRFDIDISLHRRFGHRADGQPISGDHYTHDIQPLDARPLDMRERNASDRDVRLVNGSQSVMAKEAKEVVP